MSNNQLFKDQIKWIRSSRAKHLRITVRPDRTIVVTLPRVCSRSYAERFVCSKQVWINRALERLSALKQPSNTTPVRQEHIEMGRRLLLDRLQELAMHHGFSFRRIAVRNQKTRWGSCSTLNNINLNISLIKLPDHLRDYVILHELVHTIHKNHSKAFWNKLDEVVGGKAKELRREMRQFCTYLAG